MSSYDLYKESLFDMSAYDSDRFNKLIQDNGVNTISYVTTIQLWFDNLIYQTDSIDTLHTQIYFSHDFYDSNYTIKIVNGNIPVYNKYVYTGYNLEQFLYAVNKDAKLIPQVTTPNNNGQIQPLTNKAFTILKAVSQHAGTGQVGDNQYDPTNGYKGDDYLAKINSVPLQPDPKLQAVLDTSGIQTGYFLNPTTEGTTYDSYIDSNGNIVSQLAPNTVDSVSDFNPTETQVPVYDDSQYTTDGNMSDGTGTNDDLVFSKSKPFSLDSLFSGFSTIDYYIMGAGFAMIILALIFRRK
jgi:hypothetical protein